MKRIEKVYNSCKAFTEQYTMTELVENQEVGITASDISKELQLLRNNVSADLNTLVKNDRILKITGKPTRFLCKESLEEKFNIPYLPMKTVTSLQAIFPKTGIEHNQRPLEELIGSSNSLAPVIQLAEAAINYPPKGLHTMILGESGTGKSLLAEKMFYHGRNEGIFPETAKFVVLNCADYSTNPQFLLSQLFGSIKGAYTGADSDRKGLIETAEEGILFLDEVHRLPPEGQEMLFQYIDKGSFYRLGDTQNKLSAKTLLIIATTEHPNSVLLDTFKRRIPVAIQMPSLNERDISERLELIFFLYEQEVKKINASLTVSSASIKALLSYTPAGNIGQLKSDIQLSVARALLEKKKNVADHVYITHSFFSQAVNNAKLTITADEQKIINTLVDQEKFVFGAELTLNEPNDSEYDFVEFFQNQKSTSITKAFNDYSQKIAKQRLINKHFSFLLNEDIKSIMLIISDILYEDCGIIINDNISTAFALYIYSRSNETDFLSVEPSNKMTDKKIINAVRKIIRKLEQQHSLYFSEDDVHILSDIIQSIKNKEVIEEEYGILLCAHGDRVATELSQTINQLIGKESIISIDMPLNSAPKEAYTMIKQMVTDLPYSKFLLFVDMGSMAGIENKIKEETEKNLIIIERIDTLILLETAKNKDLLSLDLTISALKIAEIDSKRSHLVQKKIEQHFGQGKRKVIYTVCRTGEGTAKFLQNNLKSVLQKFKIFDVDIKSVNGKDANAVYKKMEQNDEYDIIATVGTINPSLGFTPFIPLQEIILKDGISKLLRFAGYKETISEDSPTSLYTKSIVIDMGIEAVDKYLYFLSASKIKDTLTNVLEQIEKEFSIEIKQSTTLNLLVHTAYLIERILIQENKLTYPEQEKWKTSDIKKMQSALFDLSQQFSIFIPDDEYRFMLDILFEK